MTHNDLFIVNTLFVKGWITSSGKSSFYLSSPFNHTRVSRGTSVRGNDSRLPVVGVFSRGVPKLCSLSEPKLELTHCSCKYIRTQKGTRNSNNNNDNTKNPFSDHKSKIKWNKRSIIQVFKLLVLIFIHIFINIFILFGYIL